MDARLQRRIQRYGWDIAAPDYEPSWQAQLAVAQDEMLACAALQAGERVLDVACGTGLVTLRAAQAVGPQGEAIGTDISAGMIDIAWTRATAQRIGNVRFQRMGAESLDFPERRFDAVLCALGLMYVTHPEQALHEMRRVLRPGGRAAIAVWGERAHCGWSPVFPIVDAEVSSDVCPLFFGLGQADALARLCADAELRVREHYRVDTVLHYADGEKAYILAPKGLNVGAHVSSGQGADIKALCRDASGRLLGYALTGSAVMEKLALNKELPPLLA